MPVQTLTNCKLWVGGYDLSGDLNTIGLKMSPKLNDATVFGNDTTVNFPGLPEFKLSGTGLWQALDPASAPSVDPTLWGDVAIVAEPFILCPQTGAVGETCYLSQSVQASYNPGAKVGEMLVFTFEADSAGKPAVKSTVVENSTRTATWAGTAYQLGAVSSTQRVFAVMQVFAASGTLPTLNLLVQSASSSGFSTPNTRLTFAQATGAGAQYAYASGSITDTYWRVSGTIAGINPSFTVAVAVGIK